MCIIHKRIFCRRSRFSVLYVTTCALTRTRTSRFTSSGATYPQIPPMDPSRPSSVTTATWWPSARKTYDSTWSSIKMDQNSSCSVNTAALWQTARVDWIDTYWPTLARSRSNVDCVNIAHHRRNMLSDIWNLSTASTSPSAGNDKQMKTLKTRNLETAREINRTTQVTRKYSPVITAAWSSLSWLIFINIYTRSIRIFCLLRPKSSCV